MANDETNFHSNKWKLHVPRRLKFSKYKMDIHTNNLQMKIDFLPNEGHEHTYLFVNLNRWQRSATEGATRMSQELKANSYYAFTYLHTRIYVCIYISFINHIV